MPGSGTHQDLVTDTDILPWSNGLLRWGPDAIGWLVLLAVLSVAYS